MIKCPYCGRVPNRIMIKRSFFMQRVSPILRLAKPGETPYAPILEDTDDIIEENIEEDDLVEDAYWCDSCGHFLSQEQVIAMISNDQLALNKASAEQDPPHA